MARKSRKVLLNQDVSYQVRKSQKIPTAIYARLSVENSGNETDETLQNQIAIVENYISEHSELDLIDTYVDNGFTGTKFDRPDFNRLMSDVKCGRIQCVVVKDLSRFGRDYLKAGFYLETLFPLLNVRFISVNDNYDSSRYEDRNSLSIPVKNMVNAMYSKDFSHKVGLSIRQSQISGKVSGILETYGYKYDKEIGKLVIDAEVAPIVRMIFSWKLSGVSSVRIADRLNAMNVPSPAVYYGWNSEAKWHSGTISRIGRNPVYGGYIVQNKSHKSLYHGVKFHNTDESEWLVMPNAHEPYLSSEEYAMLCNKRKAIIEKRQKDKDARETERCILIDSFPGIVFCSDCGRKLEFSRMGRRVSSKFTHAIYHHPFDVKPGTCTQLRIQHNQVKVAVLDQINNLLMSVSDMNKLVDEISQDKYANSQLVSIKRKKSRLESNILDLKNRASNAYANCIEGVISTDEYKLIKRRIDMDMEQVQKSLKEVEDEIKNISVKVTAIRSFSDEYKEKSLIADITPDVVNKLIERVGINNLGEVKVLFKNTNFNDLTVLKSLLGINKENN